MKTKNKKFILILLNFFNIFSMELIQKNKNFYTKKININKTENREILYNKLYFLEENNNLKLINKVLNKNLIENNSPSENLLNSLLEKKNTDFHFYLKKNENEDEIVSLIIEDKNQNKKEAIIFNFDYKSDLINEKIDILNKTEKNLPDKFSNKLIPLNAFYGEFYSSVKTANKKDYSIEEINILNPNTKNLLINKLYNLDKDSFKYFYISDNENPFYGSVIYEECLHPLIRNIEAFKDEIIKKLISRSEDKVLENNFYLLKENDNIIALISYKKKNHGDEIYNGDENYNLLEQVILFDESINIFRYISAFCFQKHINLKIQRIRIPTLGSAYGNTLINFNIKNYYIRSNKKELNIINLYPDLKKYKYYHNSSFIIKPSAIAYLKCINSSFSFLDRIFSKKINGKEFEKGGDDIYLEKYNFESIHLISNYLIKKKNLPSNIILNIIKFCFQENPYFSLEEEDNSELFFHMKDNIPNFSIY